MKTYKPLLVISFSLATTLANAQEPQRYEIKSATIQYYTITKDVKITGTQYFDNYGQLEALIAVAQTENEKTQHMIIRRCDTTYTINLSQKNGQMDVTHEETINYLKLTPNVIEKYKIVDLHSSEMIANKLCSKYTLQITQMEQSVELDVWVWKGIVLKSIMKLGDVEINIQTALNVQEDIELPPALFDIPNGVTMNLQEQTIDSNNCEIIDIYGSSVKIDDETTLTFAGCRSRENKSQITFNIDIYNSSSNEFSIFPKDINIIDGNDKNIKIEKCNLWSTDLRNGIGIQTAKLQCEFECIDTVKIFEIKRKNIIYRINTNAICRKKNKSILQRSFI